MKSIKIFSTDGPKYFFFEKKIRFVPALDLIKCLKTDQITDTTPHVRTHFWVTILYKYHECFTAFMDSLKL